MHRFYLDSGNLGGNEYLLEDEKVIFQIKKVLKIRLGEKVVLFGDDFKDYYYQLKSFDKGGIYLILEKIVENNPFPKRNLRLFMAMPKKMEKFEFVLQKCAELGVSEFIPLITQRTERNNLSKKERLYSILKEAVEQCGGGKIPLLHNETALQDIFNGKSSFSEFESFENKRDLRIFAHTSLKQFDCELLKGVSSVDLFVGPEGGFTNEEFKSAFDSGLLCSSFGNRILRLETASISISSLILLA